MSVSLLLTALSPIDRLSQRAYRAASRRALLAAGVVVEGLPLWISPRTYWDAPRLGLISVGDRCVISHGVTLLVHDFSMDRVAERRLGSADREMFKTGPITIGRQAFIGMGATILPGVSIGAGAIVGACSVVTKDVEADTVVAGNPAKHVFTTAEYWDRRSEGFQWQQRRK